MPTARRSTSPAPTKAPAVREEARAVERESPAPQPGGGVVQAAERFRGLVRRRPWRRRRRAIMITAFVLVVLLVAALCSLLFLPAFRVQDVRVQGTGYADAQAIEQAAAGARGTSVLLLPTDQLATSVEKVPGVRTAEVRRSWPDGVSITVTERVPLAVVTAADGTASAVDADGVILPPEALQAEHLVPLTLGPDTQDADGATHAMLDVLASLPEGLRGTVTQISATTPSDVTLTVSVDGGGSKSVVWGDARDAALKAEVTAALLPREGSVIDVSSPVAPVTR